MENKIEGVLLSEIVWIQYSLAGISSDSSYATNCACRIHHGGGPRFEGNHGQLRLVPWELGQGSGMLHSTYLYHVRKLNSYETHDLQNL